MRKVREEVSPPRGLYATFLKQDIMMLVFLINYYSKKTNGIVRYNEILSSYLLKTRKVRVINILTRCHVPMISRSAIGDILIPYDLAFGNSAYKNDEEVSCFIDEVLKDCADCEIVFHFNWMNHTPWAYTQRKHTPRAKFLLTKHCVSWRDLITANYNVFYRLQCEVERKGALSFPLKSIVSDELFYFSFVDKIITVTEDAKSLLVTKYGISETKINRIYNGIEFQHHNCTHTQRDFGFASTDKIILYVGSITERKGLGVLLQILVKVCETHENIHLVLCGNGDFDGFSLNFPLSCMARFLL